MEKIQLTPIETKYILWYLGFRNYMPTQQENETLNGTSQALQLIFNILLSGDNPAINKFRKNLSELYDKIHTQTQIRAEIKNKFIELAALSNQEEFNQDSINSIARQVRLEYKDNINEYYKVAIKNLLLMTYKYNITTKKDFINLLQKSSTNIQIYDKSKFNIANLPEFAEYYCK